MNLFQVTAMPTRTAEEVRETGRSPGYGHPASTETAQGYGPCRHCLRTFEIGSERRTLFTYDAFDGVESLPLPGPVYIHADGCERYRHDAEFPEIMREVPLTLFAYSRGRKLVAQEYAEGGKVDGQTIEDAVRHLLARPDVDYIQVHDTEAGCYDFRIVPA